MLAQNENSILRGSRTSPKQQVREDIDNPSLVDAAIDTAVTGNPTGAATQIARNVQRVSRRPSEKTMEEIARMIFTNDPDEIARPVQMLNARRQGGIIPGVATGAGTMGAVIPTAIGQGGGR